MVGKSSIDPKAYVLKATDDACHQFTSEECFEWWYMDASFDNGYSLVTSWQMADMKYRGALMPFRVIEFAIYDPQGKKTSVLPTFKADNCIASKSSCDVTMGKNHFKGNYPRYDIDFLEGDLGCSLTLENLAQGFREPPEGTMYFSRNPDRYIGWAIAQPKAKVTGKLIVNGKEIPVTGVGYHDHNWGNCPMVDLYTNWHWGRFLSSDYTFVYAVGETSAVTGNKPQSRIMAFKGHDLVEMSDQIRVDDGELTLDPVTGVNYQKTLVLRINGANAKGTITHRVKDLVENNPTPGTKPGDGRGYLRFLSDCDIKLDVNGDKIDTRAMLIHEYIQVAKIK